MLIFRGARTTCFKIGSQGSESILPYFSGRRRSAIAGVIGVTAAMDFLYYRTCLLLRQCWHTTQHTKRTHAYFYQFKHTHLHAWVWFYLLISQMAASIVALGQNWSRHSGSQTILAAVLTHLRKQGFNYPSRQYAYNKDNNSSGVWMCASADQSATVSLAAIYPQAAKTVRIPAFLPACMSRSASPT